MNLLVTTQRNIALRCPLCGRLEFNQLSLFNFSGRSQVKIVCECGYQKITISTKNYKEYLLQVPCLICDEVHLLKFTHHDLWEKPITILRCSETGQELGYLGEPKALERIVRRKQHDIESIVNNFGFDDYFTNPQVMLEILNHLHKIAEDEHLFCTCGNNHIEIDVFPEKLELRCPYCQSIHIIYAETPEDLKLVKEVQSIAMTEKGFTSFDSSKAHPNLNS